MINQRLVQLNRGRGFHTYAPFDDGTQGLHLHDHFGPARYHGPIFVDVLDAVRDNNEDSFLL